MEILQKLELLQKETFYSRQHVVGMQCVIYNEVHPCVAGTTVFVSLSFEHLYRFSAIVLSIFVTCK